MAGDAVPGDAVRVMRRLARGAARLLAVALLAGCGGQVVPEPVRAPPCAAPPCRGAHEGEVPVLVPFPPPPAKVDVIGDPPAEMSDPVWVDGQWAWRGRAWIWEPGRWWQRPVAQYWAAPAIVRRADGQLVWFVGAFRPFVAPPATTATNLPGRSAPGGLSSPDGPGDKATRAP